LRAFGHLDLSTLLFRLRSRQLNLVGYCRATDNINKNEIVKSKKLTSLSKLSAKIINQELVQLKITIKVSLIKNRTEMRKKQSKQSFVKNQHYH